MLPCSRNHSGGTTRASRMTIRMAAIHVVWRTRGALGAAVASAGSRATTVCVEEVTSNYLLGADRSHLAAKRNTQPAEKQSLSVVVPAKAGTHTLCPIERTRRMGPRLRGDDGGGSVIC